MIVYKILLSILYPFWFFLAKTLVGAMVMLFLYISWVPAIMWIISPDLMQTTGPEAEGVGTGVAIFSLILAFPTGVLFMKVGDRLSSNYEKYGYKV